MKTIAHLILTISFLCCIISCGHRKYNKNLKLGIEKLESENYYIAIDFLDKAISAKPNKPEAYFYRGRAKEKYNESREQNDVSKYYTDIEMDFDIFFELSKDKEKALLDLENYISSQKIIMYSTEIIHKKPKSFIAYYLRGKQKYYLDDFLGANDDINAAIEINPEYSEAYLFRGIIKVFEIDNINQNIFSIYSDHLFLRSDFKENTYIKRTINGNDYSDQIRPDPYSRKEKRNKNSEEKIYLSDINVLYKDLFAEPIKNFEKCIQIDPENEIAIFNLGLLHIIEGNFKKGCLYMKKAGDAGVIDAFNYIRLYCQSGFERQLIIYNSSMYDYKISIPIDFNQTTPKGKNIDLKFVHENGTNITVNVTPRLKEEYSFTAHDYTEEMLQEAFKMNNKKSKITFSEKLYISGEEAFLIEQIDAFPDLDLKMMQCYLFHNDLSFLITATSEKKYFQKYRDQFLTSIKSLRFL